MLEEAELQKQRDIDTSVTMLFYATSIRLNTQIQSLYSRNYQRK